MTSQTVENIVKRVNLHFDNQYKKGYTSYHFCASSNYFEEHEYCYSVGWCLKSEIDIAPSERTMFVGSGPIMVSKISDHIQMAGSSTSSDFVKSFEYKIRGLSPYWNLEIQYSKSKLSSLKSLLQLNTPKLLGEVDANSKINIEGEKYMLEKLQQDLTSCDIESTLELRSRKIIEE